MQAGSTGDNGLPVAASGAPGTVFSVLTTNQKGVIAETAVAHACARLGIAVARPLSEQRYDLIFDLGSRLLRVQCKWAARSGDVVLIRTRTSRRGRKGHVHRSYGADDIDAVAAFCPDTGACYLLPQELSVNRADVRLRLGPTRNNQAAGVRWARDYELEARLNALMGR